MKFVALFTFTLSLYFFITQPAQAATFPRAYVGTYSNSTKNLQVNIKNNNVTVVFNGETYIFKKKIKGKFKKMFTSLRAGKSGIYISPTATFRGELTDPQMPRNEVSHPSHGESENFVDIYLVETISDKIESEFGLVTYIARTFYFRMNKNIRENTNELELIIPEDATSELLSHDLFGARYWSIAWGMADEARVVLKRD